MKFFKRSLALFLALVTSISILAVGAQAASVSTTTSDYGYMKPTDSKFTKTVSTVKLYGSYDYINFYIESEFSDTYFFYEIYSDKNYTKRVTEDYVYCEDRGTYTWSPFIKLKGVFNSKTYYCITYGAKMDSNGNIKLSTESVSEFKIVVDRTTAFNKQVVLLKNIKTTVNGPQITWYKHSSAATKYVIYRRSINGTKWTKVGTVNASTLTFTDKSVKNKSGKYVYTVKALNKNGTASRYQFSGLTSLYAKTPVIKSVVLQPDDQIQLKWESIPNATFYRIYRKTNGGNWEVIEKTFDSGTTYMDSDIVSGNNYQYTVRAYINTMQGTAISAYYSGKSVDYIEAPKLTGVNVVDNGIKVSWDESKGATAYTVYRRPLDLSSGWVNIGKVDAKTFRFVDKYATAQGAYRYTVRAEGKTSRGSYLSTGIDYVVLDAPVVTAELYDGTYNNLWLTWASVPYATKYEVYQKNSEGKWKLCDTLYSRIGIGKSAEIGVTEWSVRAVHESKNAISKSDIEASAIKVEYFPELSAESKIFKDNITISWDDIWQSDSYNVYRRNSGDEDFILLCGGLTQCKYEDETAETGVSYEYCVKAVYKGLEQTTNYAIVSACRTNKQEENKATVSGVYKETEYGHNYTIVVNGLSENDRVYLRSDSGEYWNLLKNNEYYMGDVKEGETYTFGVSLYVDGAYTPIDDYILEYTIVKKEAPVVTHKNSESHYTISWQAIEKAVKYEVCISSGYEYKSLATINPDGSGNYSYSFTNDYISKKTHAYFIGLRVYYENGDIGVYYIPIKYIVTPEMLSATRLSSTNVQIRWTQNTYSQPHFFYIYRREGSGPWQRIMSADPASCERAGTGNGYSYSYVDRTAKNGVAYTYTVKAAYESGVTSGYQAGVTCKAN